MMFFNNVIIYQHFLQEIELLLVFVRLQTLVLFFHCFLAFCKFQKHFFINMYYGNISLQFGLVVVEIHKIKEMLFFYQPPTNMKY